MTDQQRADAKNKRLAKRWPLLALAGQIEIVTAEQITRMTENTLARLEQIQSDTEASSKCYHDLCSQLVTAEELSQLETGRARIGHGPEYGADYYHRAANVALFFSALHGIGSI